MRNLNKATTNPETFLEDIINSKKEGNKKRMESLKPDLIERFKIYTNEANNGTLHTLVEKWHYDKDCQMCDGYFLYHQYDNSDACISKLRGEIIVNNNGEITLTCPICGLRDATDLDHYIPRQLFPEFSIHPYNLIPICHKCNNKKSTHWCESNKRTIFNAYYDRITDVSLFNVDVVIEKKLPKIILQINSFTPPIQEDIRIAVSTIKLLELLPLFNKHINKMLSKEMDRLKFERKHLTILSLNDFIIYMKQIYEDMTNKIGDVNNLDKILYSVISQNEVILQWMKNNY